MQRNLAINSAFYIPLSASSLEYGLSGPSPCAFSVPKSTYSKDTQNFIKVLMAETKLSTTQRQGFQSILRSGNEPLESPQIKFARRQEYLRRRTERGKGIGLDMGPNQNINKFKHGSISVNQLGGGRRSFEAIRATGALEPPNFTRTYIPVNKEMEKIRFSYKMAYGSEPSQDMMDQLMGKVKNETKTEKNQFIKKSIRDVDDERFDELIEEICERVEFLKSMKEMKEEKNYHSYIVYQIKEKVDELKKISPEKITNNPILQNLRLSSIDSIFANI